jgi:hypothetical protein
MTERSISVSTIVTVTVEVDAGTYSSNATFEGIREQAMREGAARVEQLLAGKGRIVGKPSVRTVMMGEARE